MTHGHAYAGCIGTISSHNDTGRHTWTNARCEMKYSEPNDDAGKRSIIVWSLSQNHLSCICVEWMVKCDSDARPYTFISLCCSAAYIIHVYIVDRLFGSMFTNGSGRTADVLYAGVLLWTMNQSQA